MQGAEKNWVRVPNPAPSVVIRLRIEFRQGRPICTGVILESEDALKAAAIGALPWKSLIQQARMEVSGGPPRSPLLPIRLDEDVRRTRSGWPRQFYDWVVFIHKVALHNDPTRPIEWITENVELPKKGVYSRPAKSTVHRWIADAEKGGHYETWQAIKDAVDGPESV